MFSVTDPELTGVSCMRACKKPLQRNFIVCGPQISRVVKVQGDEKEVLTFSIFK